MTAAAAAKTSIGRYIKLVVIVVQENRSFDNFFSGFPGADAATSGLTHDGKRVRLHPIPLYGTDIMHNWSNALASWDNGKMDGFDRTTLSRKLDRYGLGDAPKA